MAQRAIPVGAVLTLLIWATAAAHSELLPWADGDDQRRAPVVMALQVDQSQARSLFQILRARLRSIRRQPLGLLLQPGSVIEIVYAIPPQRSGGWAGPSPIPVLPAGRQTLAWLRPLPANITTGLRRFEPAAGGKSRPWSPGMNCDQAWDGRQLRRRLEESQ